MMKRAKDGSRRQDRRQGRGLGLVLATFALVMACVVVDAVVNNNGIPLVSADAPTEQIVAIDTEKQAEQTEQTEPAEQTGQKVSDDAGFFATQRLEKEKVRAQEIELLQELMEEENTTAEAREQAETRVLSIVKDMETELVLEGLLAGKYGGEAAVFIQIDRVDVILAPDTKKLEPTEVERIAELVNSYTDVGFENTVVTVR